MMSALKQSIGIDISKVNFTACICIRHSDGTATYTSVQTFKNEKTGFNQLVRWVRKACDQSIETVYLMEATGVYHEKLAHHLFQLKQTVHVVLANTAKHYFLSLNIKSKTDAIDAKVLSQFGAERTHRSWEPPAKELIELRHLTRYYVQLQEQKTALNNIQESKESAHEIQQFILKSNKTLLANIDRQIKKLLIEIERLIEQNPELKERVRKLQTIKGVGLLTVATIVAETLGFEHINNAKQLVSYAGYDVVERESGSSVKGKTRISKKGNRYIRNALYFPAMVACRYNENLKASYLRIIQRKPSKMIGQVAIQRKLLVLMYTLWKNNAEFIPGYESSSKPKPEATQDCETLPLES